MRSLGERERGESCSILGGDARGGEGKRGVHRKSVSAGADGGRTHPGIRARQFPVFKNTVLCATVFLVLLEHAYKNLCCVVISTSCFCLPKFAFFLAECWKDRESVSEGKELPWSDDVICGRWVVWTDWASAAAASQVSPETFLPTSSGMRDGEEGRCVCPRRGGGDLFSSVMIQQ